MVLFTSDRPLGRAENITAVYNMYAGEKRFIQTDPYHFNPEILDKKYNLRVTDDFPHIASQRCILIGHGITGGKLVGLDQPRPFFKRNNARYLSYVICTSKVLCDLVAKQSGVSINAVLPLGMPRTDIYFGACKGDGNTFLADKRAYLYAPTYRSIGETKIPQLDWEFIDSELDDSEVFIVKPHMMMGKMLNKEYQHIIEVSKDEPSTPYLFDCDVLITDYSSILLDAHLLKKPVVLFEKQKGYTETRGMYLKYPEGYASRYCTNEKDLLSLMRTAFEQEEADLKCLEITAGACDGHSTERVVDLIKGLV